MRLPSEILTAVNVCFLVIHDQLRFAVSCSVSNGFYHMKTRTLVIGLVEPPNTRHINLTTFAPNNTLSSDHIVTWSVHRLCIMRRSYTSRFQNCDETNTLCVAVATPRILHQIWHYFTAIQRILVASQFWLRKVKELLKLHNLHTDHDIIRSEPNHLIGAKEQPKWEDP
jgi:hypothetical protein